MWHLITTLEAIPTDRSLLLAVVDQDGLHALAFPCRCSDGCWIDIRTGRLVDVRPTHWREWPAG
jgi:hypothetical protein